MFSLFPSRAIALTIGPLRIHWYGIMYALAFLLGMWLLPRLLRLARLQLSAQDRETLVLWIFFGVVLGGRLGFLMFYEGSYFWQNPAKIIAVWEGGMASHGGLLGVLLALIIFSARKKIDFFRLADVLVIPGAIGLAFGRLGNLINGELYGTVTTLPWGMAFPGIEGLRHPTQIYAIAKDLFIASACFLHLRRSIDRNLPSGQTAGLFLILYGALRFIVEIVRDQPYGYSSVLGFELSRGQLLTVPVIVAGCVVMVMRRQRSRFETP